MASEPKSATADSVSANNDTNDVAQTSTATGKEEEDPRVWKEVTTALESYKEVEVRKWTRELVLQKQLIDDRLFRCEPLTKLTLVVPNLDDTLGKIGLLKNLVTLEVRNCGLSELPRSLEKYVCF